MTELVKEKVVFKWRDYKDKNKENEKTKKEIM